MHKIYLVAVREYLETVKTKMFIFSVVITPVLIIGIVVLSMRLTEKSMRGPRPAKTVAIVDLSKSLAEELEGKFQRHNARHEQRQIVLQKYGAGEADSAARIEQLKADVRERKLDACVVLPENVLEGGTAQYYTRNVADMELHPTVQGLINDAAVDQRVHDENLSREIIGKIMRHVPLEQIDLSAKTEQKRESFEVMMVPFLFLFMMFMGVFGTSQFMLNSVVEEKGARVMEVLLSAVTPFELMADKIAGLTGAGLTLVGVWGGAAYGGAAYRGMTHILSPTTMAYFAIYYLLGFVLFSSFLAAIGSVCNTTKEAQALMGPISLLIILPMLVWFYIAQHPDSTMAIVLSFVPPITPMIMIVRIAVRPDLSILQIAASILVLGASVPAVIWASAKIFRTGILMYGKPPSLRELVRWLRYK